VISADGAEVGETSDSSLSLECRRAVGGVSDGAARCCSDAVSTEVNKTSGSVPAPVIDAVGVRRCVAK
jgi:hypothetical protein